MKVAVGRGAAAASTPPDSQLILEGRTVGVWAEPREAPPRCIANPSQGGKDQPSPAGFAPLKCLGEGEFFTLWSPEGPNTVGLSTRPPESKMPFIINSFLGWRRCVDIILYCGLVFFFCFFIVPSVPLIATGQKSAKPQTDIQL